MAYIQITTVCNMSCAHCCMSCGKNYKGQHMSSHIFQCALDFCSETGSSVTLGGGEPTLHPDFIYFLGKSISHCQSEDPGTVPWFATNGSNTKKTLELMYSSNYCEEEFFEKLSEECWIDWTEEPLFIMAVSQDQYHDPIDDVVFKTAKMLNIEIRKHDSSNIVKTGHANHGSEDRCCCEDFQIKPDGDIFMCGCDGSPRIGNVVTGLSLTCEVRELYEITEDRCYKSIPEERKDIITQDWFTLREWVDQNIPVKKNKIDHPETYRISLY